MERDRARVAPLCLGPPGTTAHPRPQLFPGWGRLFGWGEAQMRAARGVKSLVNCFPVFRVFRLSVICVGQTLKLVGFKDPAREIPTPPSEYIPLRAALRRRRPAYFLRRGGNLE